VTDARKAGEKKQIPVPGLAFAEECCILQHADFLLGEKVPFGCRLEITIGCERITGHQPVIERDVDNIDQTIQITASGSRFEPAFRFQKDGILLDERLFQLGERHIADSVCMLHERPQMVD